MERVIRVSQENNEQIINMRGENAEQYITMNREIATQIPLVTTDHAQLNHLDFERSGHTGFQHEMDVLSNIEIERMWNSI